MLKIIQLSVLNDNYIYLIHDELSGETAVVDPAVAEPVLDYLAKQGWQLKYVLNTHHHADHVEGNTAIKQRTGCTVVAGQTDAHRIPDFDRGVSEGDTLFLGQHKIKVMITPGHTTGHVVYYFEKDDLLFCGDTLFVMGCGRLFEGTPEQMYASLQKLKALPAETKVYCAHEYTQANGKFALSVESDNQVLQDKLQRVAELRRNNLSTVPSTIAEEIATNPFFRTESLSIQKTLDLGGANQVEVFTALRKRKDVF